ncbi:Hypothetical predicted protein [Pelobates cultripes]|uniref:Uncharacterized protein n=1 Tax=Pelobates cultripes TaxID=61616 RepID=A0AAD1SCQ2_PELCU|nr:Hypothetical predicted protein [Pelobates cultripes]
MDTKLQIETDREPAPVLGGLLAILPWTVWTPQLTHLLPLLDRRGKSQSLRCAWSNQPASIFAAATRRCCPPHGEPKMSADRTPLTQNLLPHQKPNHDTMLRLDEIFRCFWDKLWEAAQTAQRTPQLTDERGC